ncbi:hypothetical protein SSZBM1_9 [Synechococcus phage S-SZBM1]|uniref:Uncharacterized protein n=1 Tax=Synechococcus phage S-SZBM1 TaxID=2926475 RepID=A0AC61TSB2_9CAUD|nr:hypothetical protein PP650_gp009 [Synechococcus phage S-SZBM1]UNH61126.1 hypothetical protein SSZBM1_9 [Synechococcus phage S-SZBM1]
MFTSLLIATAASQVVGITQIAPNVCAVQYLIDHSEINTVVVPCYEVDDIKEEQGGHCV